MGLEERLSQVMQNTVEVVQEAELRDLLETADTPKAYIGLEPSGLVHLGTGPIQAQKVIDLQDSGFDVTVLLADWHAYINDKLGGDWEAIQASAELLQEAYRALGVPKTVRFAYASELVADSDYWKDVLRAAKACSLARVRRALDIMGRHAEEAEQDVSKLFYPAMQVTDMHRLDLDLALGGMDQRRAHMLYREVSPKLGWKQVIALHTPMLSGLQGGGRMDSWDLKMSKSKPETAIFIHDAPEVIASKIEQAYCPPGRVEGNPVLQFAQYLLFPRLGPLEVSRASKYGGDVEYADYDALEEDYRDGTLHPQDLKAAVARSLNTLLEGPRKALTANGRALQQVLELTTQ